MKNIKHEISYICYLQTSIEERINAMSKKKIDPIRDLLEKTFPEKTPQAIDLMILAIEEFSHYLMRQKSQNDILQIIKSIGMKRGINERS